MISAEGLAQRCERYRPTKTGFQATCPAHNDAVASLAITPSHGKVLLYCHAGCQTSVILDALGLTWKDLQPAPVGANGTLPRSREVARYHYVDAQGAPLYDTIRYEPKRFRQQRADGAWTLDGVERVLYRLPQVLHAETVYVVEGEKDVHTIEKLGLVGTTAPMGAKKWHQEYSWALRGKKVVLLPDHDEVGLEHMRLVAQSLHGVAASVRLVILPGLADKGDVSDWLQAGGTREELEALVEATPLYRDERPLIPPAPQDASRPAIHSVPLADVTPEAMEWLWWPYLPRGAVVLLDGDPGVGKSFLTLAMAAAVSQGWPLPDCQGVRAREVVRPPANAYFFATEDSLEHTVRQRVDPMGADLSRILFSRGIPEPHGGYRQFTLAEPALLRQILEAYRPLLVVIDPIQAYLGSKVDMYRPNEVRPLMGILAQYAQEFNCTFLCLRHLAKNSGQVAMKSMMRGLGSIDFGGIARSILFCDRHPLDRNKSLMIQVKSNVGVYGRTQVFDKTRGVFTWAGVTRLDEDAVQQATGRDFYRAFFWLEDKLHGGIAQPSKDLLEEAKDRYELDSKSVYAARAAMNARISRQGFGKESIVMWSLPSLDILQQEGELSCDNAPF